MGKKWTELAIGIILIVSPWVFGFSDISVAKWCNVLVGLSVALIATWELFAGMTLVPAHPESKRKISNIKATVEK
jgi:hypothetical protein